LHRDLDVARIARLQKGVITRAQLDRCGIGRGGIAYRLRCGRLHRLHPGVYLVGHGVAAEGARELAAVLACGQGAVASHDTAAALWGFRRVERGPVEITIPTRHRASRPGIRVHRTAALAAGEVRRHDGIPLTAPARTLLDLAQALDDRALERAVDEAIVQRLASERELRAAVAGAYRRPGTGRLEALLGREAALTRSEAEERFRELMAAAEVPAPVLNARIAGYEVDAYWPGQRLAVEIDGFRFHASRAAFERDRRRDAALQAAGVRVLRLTWRRLQGAPMAVVATVVQALAAGTGRQSLFPATPAAEGHFKRIAPRPGLCPERRRGRDGPWLLSSGPLRRGPLNRSAKATPPRRRGHSTAPLERPPLRRGTARAPLKPAAGRSCTHPGSCLRASAAALRRDGCGGR
jgi:Transcriptional regulator, AbiEi antitoxin/Protein of unknown function (DUF559)